jgi:hypothetical protein
MPVLSAPAFAQAWLPEKGSGAVSFQYQNGLVREHYFGSSAADVGHIESHSVIADVFYGLTDRLAVRFNVPFIVAKYNGPKPHILPGLPNHDNGRYHGTLQDLRFDVRYALTPYRALNVTPFAAAIVPSHNYLYFAHSAAGTDLHEVQIGTFVARTLEPFTRQVFVQARVAYGFFQPVLGIKHNRSYIDLELGYAPRPGFRVFLLGTSLTTHGGVNFVPPPNTLSALEAMGPDFWQHHDQIADERSTNIGLGGAVEITRSLDLFGSIGTNVLEVNGHAMARALSVGVTWHFSRGDALGDLREEPRRMAARCVCAASK